MSEKSKSPSPYQVAVPAALADYAADGGEFHFESSRSEQAPLEIHFQLSDPDLYDRLLLERLTTLRPATPSAPSG